MRLLGRAVTVRRYGTDGAVVHARERQNLIEVGQSSPVGEAVIE